MAASEILQIAFIPVRDGRDMHVARLGVERSFAIQEDGSLRFQPISRLPQETSGCKSNSKKGEGVDTIFVQGKFVLQHTGGVIFASERVLASVQKIIPRPHKTTFQ